MSFLEDLPSVPSSRFSRADIELFDEHREKYRKGVGILKYFLDRTQTTVDVNKLREITKMYYGDEGTREYVEHVIWKNSDPSNKFWSAIGVDPPKEDQPFIKKTRYINVRKRANKYIGSFFIEYMILTAFYIPENLEWFRLFFGRVSDEDIVKEDIVGYYERDYNPIQGNFNLSLESILKRANDYSFLEENSSRSLENLLENSKKGMILPTCDGDEIIEIENRRYKRITLIHPGIVNLNREWLNIETPNYTKIYYEVIEQSYGGYLSPHLWNKFFCDLCFCDLGPEGYKLIEIKDELTNVLNS